MSTRRRILRASSTIWTYGMHLCGGKAMENLQEPIDHTKLLGKWGYKIKHFL
jgi:hypothetical protein